jgi:hypothetical protein
LHVTENHNTCIQSLCSKHLSISSKKYIYQKSYQFCRKISSIHLHQKCMPRLHRDCNRHLSKLQLGSTVSYVCSYIISVTEKKVVPRCKQKVWIKYHGFPWCFSPEGVTFISHFLPFLLRRSYLLFQFLVTWVTAK